MEVYIVFRRLDEGADAVCAVFSTEELAEHYINTSCSEKSSYYVEPWQVDA